MNGSPVAQAFDIYGMAFRGGTATLLARVVDEFGAPLRPDDVIAAEYSVYELNLSDPNYRQAVPGHHARSLAVRDLLLPELRRDYPWDVDEVGYNFRHTLDAAVAPPFPGAGRHYLVEFRLQPAVGQVIIVRFRVYTI